MERYVAETDKALRELARRLDFWIDVDRIEERSTGTVVIQLLQVHRTKQLGLPVERASSRPAGRLVINEAQQFRIDDRARVGLYDIVEIFFDPNRSELVLRSGFPMILTVLVRRLHVSLELD